MIVSLLSFLVNLNFFLFAYDECVESHTKVNMEDYTLEYCGYSGFYKSTLPNRFAYEFLKSGEYGKLLESALGVNTQGALDYLDADPADVRFTSDAKGVEDLQELSKKINQWTGADKQHALFLEEKKAEEKRRKKAREDRDAELAKEQPIDSKGIKDLTSSNENRLPVLGGRCANRRSSFDDDQLESIRVTFDDGDEYNAIPLSFQADPSNPNLYTMAFYDAKLFGNADIKTRSILYENGATYWVSSDGSMWPIEVKKARLRPKRTRVDTTVACQLVHELRGLGWNGSNELDESVVNTAK